MNNIYIEEKINSLLQRDIIIYNTAQDKILKKGKLIIYKVKEFYYVFTLENEKGELKEYELPYPFHYHGNETYLSFNYELDSFAKNNSFIDFKARVLNFKKKSKLYNSVVVLSAV
jgi:hypothetical protein